MVGGPLHGRRIDIDREQQSMPAGGCDRGSLYVRRVWRHPDGRTEFMMMLSTLSLDECCRLVRQLLEPARPVLRVVGA